MVVVMSKTTQPFETPLSAGCGLRSDGDVLMLYQGSEPHTAHKLFGDAVGAEYRHFETGARLGDGADQGSPVDRLSQAAHLPTHDVVIAEGSAPLQTLLAYTARYPSTTALYLAADETFHTLGKRRARHVWTALRPATERLLDGVVAVGEDVAQWCRPYLGDVPTRIVHPPISDDKHDLLASLSIRSPADPVRILSVGTAQASKQQGEIVAAAERADCPAEVVLLGAGHESAWYADVPFVKTPGFVPLEEFAEWFERSSIYIQASEGDSYPVATLEAMLAGLPTVVTNACGTRQRLPDEQVCEPSTHGLSGRIEALAGWSETEREMRGRAHRESVDGLTTDGQALEFAMAVQELVHQ